MAYDKAQLQTCLQNQKKKYEAFMKMKNTSGLGWDHDMELPLCEDAEWNTYVMYNKDAKEFRHKTLANFDLLDEYFSGTIATGEYASASGRLGHKPNAYSANAVAKDIEDDSSAEEDPDRVQSSKSSETSGSPVFMNLPPVPGEKAFGHDVLEIVKTHFARGFETKDIDGIYCNFCTSSRIQKRLEETFRIQSI